MHWVSKTILIMLSFALSGISDLRANVNSSSDTSEAEIRAQADAYVKAFDQQDVDKLASFWTKDAVYYNITTKDTIQGQDEIKAYFKDQFAAEGEETLNLKIHSVTIKEPGKATESGFVEINSTALPSSHSVFTADLVKENGSWLLKKVEEADIVTPPSHYEQLKDLEWMVGSWTSESEGKSLKLTVTWDRNKNFLTQKFNLSLLDEVDLDGQQIIGWDASKERIRSWIFDSDGGFGEGLWSHQDKDWYVSMSFTLPDGRKASATHIYTPVDANSFKFAVEDRDVDGKLLPDSEPVTITKTK